MSRTIFTVVLAAGLALAVGCGSKDAPALPNVAVEGEPSPPVPADPNAPPKAEPPKVEPPKGPTWEIDPDKHAIPATAVKGNISGAEVAPEVTIEGEELVFRVMQPGTAVVERKLRLRLAPMLLPGQPAPPVLGRNWKVKADAVPGPAVPEVWIEVPAKNTIHAFVTGYALTLELGQRKDGKVSGKVFLSVADEGNTVLAGTFEAVYARPHTERPGSDDAPFVSGEVTVTGAKPDAEVRVTYAAFTPTGVFFKELEIAFDPLPIEQARWTRDDTPADMPRVSTLVSGDGKARPARYEPVKLPPGRYLLSAGVLGGPAVWKWVDIAAGATLTENFALDATKTGGVEISTAPGATGKVSLAPADEPTRPPLDPDFFQTIALQVVRQDADIVGGKATVKNLAPGRYEVRAGDERRTVEIVAGKVAELDMTPPKK